MLQVDFGQSAGGFCEDDLDEATIPFEEGPFAVAKIIVPHPDESVVKPLLFDLCNPIMKTGPPMPQRLRIVVSKVF